MSRYKLSYKTFAKNITVYTVLVWLVFSLCLANTLTPMEIYTEWPLLQAEERFTLTIFFLVLSCVCYTNSHYWKDDEQ